MPYFSSSNEWYEQSSLLLKARPSTARITSKYTVLKPTSSKISKRQKYQTKRAQTTPQDASSEPQTTQDTEAPTATFTLKTYDPVSGTCLQYETNKAAEVGRLIATLGRLGKHMAAIEEVTTDISMPAGNAGIESPAGVETPIKADEDVKMEDVVQKVPAAGGGGGGAGGKKKKKGKK